MKRIRYLSLLLMLLSSLTTWAQEEDFNPASPAEPGQIFQYYNLTLVADPVEAASSLTGGGKYKAGTSVTLKTSTATGWKFVNWTDKDGNVVTSPYTTKAKAETLTANFKYTPDDPNEPGEITYDVRYWLTIAVEEGGTVSGGGRYAAGTQNTVRASANTGYEFVGWYDSEGENCLSTNTSYKVTMVEGGLALLAKFKYCPDSPEEPSQIPNNHRIYVSAEEGGTASTSSSLLQEGETATLTAHTNSGYLFDGWYLNGVLYTTSEKFTYTMGTSSVRFEARFKYNPDSPKEPTPPTERHYTMYLMNIIGKPGDTVKFPIHVSSNAVASNMTFQLTFPTELVPMNINTPLLADVAAGFELSVADGSDVEEGQTAYLFILSGSELPESDVALMTFDIKIPESQETGKGYPIYINQISITNTDESTETASARHGRVSVYKNGDSNGDNKVNVVDITNVISKITGNNPAVFIEEVSDVNEDGDIDNQDVKGIATIVLDKNM